MVPQIGGHDHAERARRGQHPDLGPSQIDPAVTVPHRPARRPAWQVEVACQRIAIPRRASTRRRPRRALLPRLRSGRSRLLVTRVDVAPHGVLSLTT